MIEKEIYLLIGRQIIEPALPPHRPAVISDYQILQQAESLQEIVYYWKNRQLSNVTNMSIIKAMEILPTE